MRFVLPVVIFVASTLPAYAWWCPVPVTVPEIDAHSGTTAIAVICAVAALIWERRRKHQG